MKKKISKNLIAILIVLLIRLFVGGIIALGCLFPEAIPYMIGVIIFIGISSCLFISIRESLDY